MTDVAGPGRARRADNTPLPPDAPSAPVDPRALRQAADARHEAFVAAAPTTAPPVAGAGRPRSLESLTKDVLARRADVARDPAPPKVGALAEATSAWCAEATARGLKPAGESFVPARASDEDLRAATLWTEIGGALPVHSFPDGGAAFRKDLGLARLARSPFELRVAPDTPALRAACHRELSRLGEDTAPRANETVAGLADRIALARQTAATKEAGEAPRVFIGASGRVGSEATVAAADFEAYLSAMVPGTTAGGILAASYAGDLDAMQRAGALGNELEDIASPVARGKHTDHPLVGRAADNHRP